MTTVYDQSVVLDHCFAWTTLPDLSRSLYLRDRAWNERRVEDAVAGMILDGRLDVATTSTGTATVPLRVRQAQKRPGEIPPREGPEGMERP